MSYVAFLTQCITTAQWIPPNRKPQRLPWLVEEWAQRQLQDAWDIWQVCRCTYTAPARTP